MSYGEYARALQAKTKIQKEAIKRQAYMDYSFSNLIAISVARLFSKNADMPQVEEFYSWLFDEQEKEEQIIAKQEREKELSVLRFKQFAEQYNKAHYNQGGE